ncbi:hypothetical protein D3C72_2551190 [compost metagenome]
MGQPDRTGQFADADPVDAFLAVQPGGGREDRFLVGRSLVFRHFHGVLLWPVGMALGKSSLRG